MTAGTGSSMLPSVQPHSQQPIKIQGPQAEPFPMQCNTARSDYVVAGPKLYMDPAWKQKRSLAADHKVAGLGVYCHFQEQGHDSDIFIQATTTEVVSALQAEAEALVLAAKAVSVMCLQEPTFFSDCLALSRAAVTSSLTDCTVPWEVRKQVLDFKNSSAHLLPNIFHISSDFNGVAHNCAQQAIRSSRSEPTFSCMNSAHRNSACQNLQALSSLCMPGTVIHSVFCL